MKITVLGKSPSWQDAGRRLQRLPDRGGGRRRCCSTAATASSAKLRERIDYVDLDAVLISHLHADHFLDLVPYSYALTYAPKQQPVPVHTWPGTDQPARPRLIAPPGARDVFRQVVGAWGNDDLIENAFELEEYAPGDSVDVGEITASFHPVPHFIDTFAVNITRRRQRAGSSYSADTRPGRRDRRDRPRRRPAAGRGDAAPPGAHRRPRAPDPRGGRRAREARRRAKRVVITHISDELGDDWAREEAERGFGGPVEVAREGATLRGSEIPVWLSFDPMTSQRDPFADFARMRREMDELLGDFWDQAGYRDRTARRRRRSCPASTSTTAARTGPRSAIVKVDLPGVDVDAINLEVRGRTLVITGERPVRETEGRTYQQVELPSGPFRRVVELSGRRPGRRGPGHLRGRHPPRRAAGAAPRERPPGPDRERERGAVTDLDRDLASVDEQLAGAEAPEIEVVEMPDVEDAVRGEQPLPDALPVLPLRETVTFPDTLTPLAVGQERSIKLVNDVLSGNRMLAWSPPRTRATTRPARTTSTASASPARSRG